jgi:ferredoxin-NADP reductase
VISREKPVPLPKGWKWVQSERMTGEQLLQVVPDAKERHTYLSGPPGMVGSLKSALRRSGARRIHTDVFVGY